MARELPPIEIKPAQGGRLMSSLSAEAAGLESYVTKRDMRRYYDREIRAEGCEYFVLNRTIDPYMQYLPNHNYHSPITLVAEARRGDGKKVIIAGSPTQLFAYTGTEDTHYVLNALAQSDYFANDTGTYVDETQHGWILIANLLTSPARRWEAVPVGDYICLNNGVDLPLTYRPGDMQANPIYELREQQVASVGTIAVHGDNLLVFDLTIINDADFLNIMTPVTAAAQATVDSSGQVTAWEWTLGPGPGPGIVPVLEPVSGPAQALFPDYRYAQLIGKTLFWPTGEAVRVLSATASTLQTDATAPIPLGVPVLENPAAYASFTNASSTQRYPWRMLPSLPGNPRRFGAIIPVQASLNSRQLFFKYPVKSLPELCYFNQAGNVSVTSTIGGTTEISVLYAGLAGATLTTAVIGIRDGIAMSCLISDPVLNPIYDTDSTGGNAFSRIEATDASDSYAGTYTDLVGDGSAVLKALQLRDQIVVYKETGSIFLGTFTGDSTTPYQFTEIKLANQGQALRYRNCIIPTGGGYYGSSHIYAGLNAFYKFDLFTQTPQEMPELQAAQGSFYQNAIMDPEDAYAAENPLTQEWYFGWANNGVSTDRALALDYNFKTCRTTSMPMASGAKVQHPTRGDWLYIFGGDDGTIQRYGLYDAPAENPAGITVTLSAGVVTASTAYWTVDHVGKTLQLATGDFVAITGFTSSTQVTYSGTAPNTTGATAFKVLPAIWHRNGAPYNSVLESGLGDMNVSDSEKLVTAYVAIASSKSPNSTLAVAFKKAVNPSDTPIFVQSATISNVLAHNLLQPTFIANYIGVQLTLNGLNNPFELTKQIWRVKPINSHSISRL